MDQLTPALFLRKVLYFFIIVLAIILGMNLFTSSSASAEWIYTLEWINVISTPALIILGMIILVWSCLLMRKGKYGKFVWFAAGILACLFYAIPLLCPDYIYLPWRTQYILSTCWALAFIFSGVLFFMAASISRSLLASILCFTGSIILGFGGLEIIFLLSEQALDAMTDQSANSRYNQVQQGTTIAAGRTPGQCGLVTVADKKNLPIYHRLSRFDEDLFDVRYDFDNANRRILPKAEDNAPNNLMLFGCSYTFGHGIENEETWAWQLAKLLGPSWKLENYAFNAYGANQMLCLLEHQLIEAPTGKNRYAFFLGINHHIRRNEFFPNTPHYMLDGSNEAQAGGKARFYWVFRLPYTFNGSQLARQASAALTAVFTRNASDQTRLYLAVIKKSAQILQDKYDTKLIVLLWPDLEYLREDIEKMGIPALSIKSMLPDWDKTEDDPGLLYRIHKYYEIHPNFRATQEIANALAIYLKKLITQD